MPMHPVMSTEYDYNTRGQWPNGQAIYKAWGNYTNVWAWMAEQDEPIEMAGTLTGRIAMFNSAMAHSRIPWEDRDDWQPNQ